MEIKQNDNNVVIIQHTDGTIDEYYEDGTLKDMLSTTRAGDIIYLPPFLANQNISVETD